MYNIVFGVGVRGGKHHSIQLDVMIVVLSQHFLQGLPEKIDYNLQKYGLEWPILSISMTLRRAPGCYKMQVCHFLIKVRGDWVQHQSSRPGSLFISRLR